MKIILNNSSNKDTTNNNLFNNKNNFLNLSKTKKKNKQKEKILNHIVKLSEFDLSKLLKNKRTYDHVEENDESENESASASDIEQKLPPTKNPSKK